MKITILLSTYNGESYLPEFLTSLEAQIFQDWNLIIRDDGSTDGTLQIIDKSRSCFPGKIQWLQDNDGNIGSAKSFMRLLEYAETPYIMFCDQDDVWMNNKINLTMVKMHELENDYGLDIPLLVFTDMNVVDSELNLLHNSFWDYQKLDPEISRDWKKLLAQNVITGCTVMINQGAKKVCLPYTFEEMLHDHWIGVNVAQYGIVKYLDTPTLLYRQHSKNVEGAHFFGWRYVIHKIKTISAPLRKLYRASIVFPKASLGRLLICKCTINIERLFRS